VRGERSRPTEDAALAPAPPRPQGAYVPALATEALVLTAGMTPRQDGTRIGAEVSLDDGRAAAAIAATNAVAAATSVVGGREGLRRALRLTVYICAADGFTNHSLVADGASGRLLELLGPDAGVVVRSAVGVASLPGGACVEVELTCERARTSG
jgi:enamine deaminase RidA (YjgF/YER057c/UK114 family)